MAVKLSRTTETNQVLNLIAPVDDVLDWDAMFPDIPDHVDRVKEYRDGITSISPVMKEGIEPTYFVFKHPLRHDVATQVRGIFTPSQEKKKVIDVGTEVFNIAFMGTKDGINGVVNAPTKKTNGRITDDYMQSLQDSDVFHDLVSMFLSVHNETRDKTNVTKK